MGVLDSEAQTQVADDDLKSAAHHDDTYTRVNTAGQLEPPSNYCCRPAIPSREFGPEPASTQLLIARSC